MIKKIMLLCIACIANPVNAATINFDNLADSTSVTNQFSGLSFQNATILTSGISLNEFEFPPHSGDNVVFDDNGPLTIAFTTPVISVDGYLTYLTTLNLDAYDLSNTLVTSISSAFFSNLALSGDTGSSPNELLSLSYVGGISRLVITGDTLGSSFTLDDLTVSYRDESPIPEPGSLALFCIGAFSLRLRHSRRSSRN